eukprot:1843386-Amphidinium_carterae.1
MALTAFDLSWADLLHNNLVVVSHDPETKEAIWVLVWHFLQKQWANMLADFSLTDVVISDLFFMVVIANT